MLGVCLALVAGRVAWTLANMLEVPTSIKSLNDTFDTPFKKTINPQLVQLARALNKTTQSLLLIDAKINKK